MRIGYLVESFYIPAWLYAAIDKALALEGIVPCVLILNLTVNKSTPDQPNKSSIKKLNDFLFENYAKWDKKRYKKRYINDKNDAFGLRDIRILLPNIPIIELQHGHNNTEKQELETITASNLDILFNTSLNKIEGELLKLPTHGIWSYHHGDPEKKRNGPDGFWESYYDEGFIVSVLQCITKNSNERHILAQVSIPTNEERSLSMTSNALAWDSSPLLYLCLKKLIDSGTPFLNPNKRLPTNGFKYKTPGALNTITMFLKFIYKKLRNPPGFVSQHWSIRISNQAHESKKALLNINEFTTLKQPKGTFWADPFLISIENKDYLFFEEFNYETRKGIIKVGEINQAGFVDEPITILEEQFHFSNPYVFIEDDTIYLLPEQAESGEIALYRCLKFPDQWEKATTLLKGGYFVDPMLLKQDGKWWLFFVERMADFGQPTIYGKLWFSENLLGPWQEHPMSPISMDCRYSRSAGAIFQLDNQTIRVVQDCSYGYGYKINFLKIKQLTETLYEDELIKSIEPEQLNVEGIHTINFSNDLTVIDTRKKIRRNKIG